MTAAVARCKHCHGELEIEIVVTPDPETAKQLTTLTRLLRAHIRTEENDMGTIEDGLTQVEAGVTAEETVLETLSEDETRELADLTTLKNQQNGELSDADQARFDALTARVAADTAAAQADDDAINAADPAPVVTPPADGGDAPTDGTDDVSEPTSAE